MTRCKICRCTYDRACANSCSWASKKQEKALQTSPLCSNCAEILERLVAYSDVAWHFSMAALAKAIRRMQDAPAPARRPGSKAEQLDSFYRCWKRIQLRAKKGK